MLQAEEGGEKKETAIGKRGENNTRRPKREKEKWNYLFTTGCSEGGGGTGKELRALGDKGTFSYLVKEKCFLILSLASAG